MKRSKKFPKNRLPPLKSGGKLKAFANYKGIRYLNAFSLFDRRFFSTGKFLGCQKSKKDF